ncbi:MAG: alanine racemase [Hyphomicrobiales bacterium]|nr:alanine racemase [Hyphomicrobiales bacterium]
MDDHAGLLTIDRAALAANWRLLAARAGGAECAAVVKADAYGLGLEHAVPALAAAGCRSFFVAHVGEGFIARAYAPDAAIYVLNGFAAGRISTYRSHRLRPVLGSAAEIEAWHQLGAGCEPAALHVDTGMNRLGLRPEEARVLIEAGNLAERGIGLLMTHFASAEIADAPENAAQIARISDLAALMRSRGGANAAIPVSLANSSGLFLPGAPFFDLARPGYALYGGNPVPGRPNPMRPVIRLEAPIVQIRAVPAGECVGYNGNWRAARASRIATISCGYADGYPRNAGNSPDHPGGRAIVAGRECPFAGNVSMDLITLDITALPEGAVRPGDMATLIGDGLDLDAVGRSARTTGYEILTNLGRRYRRVIRD